MLRNLKFGVLVGAAILVVSAMATSAAYVSVNINRPASAKLTADNNAGAAVMIQCINNTAGGGPNYTSLCTYDAAGSVTVALENALKSDGSISFNRNATFTVGASSANSRVIKVTNQSLDSITVYFDSTSTDGTIAMRSEAGTALTAWDAGTPVGDAVGPGLSKEYYFELTTPDVVAATLDGQIQIR